uniref:Uncharacterized protein n=1 Tax=Solanum tuberosum TaxID=4113 RepID=M1DVB8_SOLTU
MKIFIAIAKPRDATLSLRKSNYLNRRGQPSQIAYHDRDKKAMRPRCVGSGASTGEATHGRGLTHGLLVIAYYEKFTFCMISIIYALLSYLGPIHHVTPRIYLGSWQIWYSNHKVEKDPRKSQKPHRVESYS